MIECRCGKKEANCFALDEDNNPLDCCFECYIELLKMREKRNVQNESQESFQESKKIV